MILSENLRQSIADRSTGSDNNVFLISDSKYAYDFMVANILQMNSSFVVNDIGGKIYAATAEILKENGYTIKVFDTTNPENSILYNPIKYVKEKTDAKMLAECIVNNLSERSEETVIAAEIDILATAIMSVVTNSPQKDMEAVLKMVQQTKNEDAQVLKSVANILNLFLNPRVKQVTSSDNVNLNVTGNTLTALFVIMPEEKSDIDLLATLIMMQAVESVKLETCKFSNK